VASIALCWSSIGSSGLYIGLMVPRLISLSLPYISRYDINIHILINIPCALLRPWNISRFASVSAFMFWIWRRMYYY